MKKALTLLLAFVMVFSIVGCSGDSDANQKEPSQSGTKDSKTEDSEGKDSDNSTASVPLTDKKATLTVFSQLDTKAAMMVTTYDELESFKAIEEKTNVHIDWQHPSGDDREAFTLMVSTGNYPDIIYWDWLNEPGGPEKFVKDGVIIDLTKLVEEYAPNYMAQLKKKPEYPKQVTTDGGTLWGFALLFDDFDDPAGYPKAWLGPQIRQDWLDRVGAELPTNIEEWTNVLRLFKAEDADGDGDSDNEIPFISNNNAFGSNLGFGGFATAWGILWGFYNDNGAVKYGPIQDGAREFLKTMALWYKEGLIDKDFAGQDNTAVDSKIKAGDVGSWWTGAPRWGHYVVANPDKDIFNPVPVKWPKGECGKSYTTNADVKIPATGTGAAVSTTCKNKELAVRWLDYLYSEEGSTIMNWGIEGKSFVEENGKKVFTDEILKNPEGLNVEQAISKYTFVPLSGWACMQDGYAKRATIHLPGQIEMYDFWSDASPDLILPRYTLTKDEVDRVAKILNNVDTYVNENAMKMVLGEKPIDDFDVYVKDIKNMGIEEAIEHISKAVERYNNR